MKKSINIIVFAVFALGLSLPYISEVSARLDSEESQKTGDDKKNVHVKIRVKAGDHNKVNTRGTYQAK
ncbi:MAG: hypothetical protein H2057_01280 [Alphaproteobacteria bacterium]|nr:hypothetical protein [Alphaproteobacteria bacterium]